MKRVVVKVGSHILGNGNDLAFDRIKKLVAFLADLSREHDVILVSSGAIIAGYNKLDIDGSVVANRQAIAAVGQPYLMSVYEKELNLYNIYSAQILLGSSDFDSRKSTTHAKDVIDTLINNKIIPIINENDTTNIDEIIFGDNDQLAAHVAYDFKADLLIILSDLEGYYDKDLKMMHKEINNITDKDLLTDSSQRQIFNRGGIITKLRAAKFLLDRDKEMFMASGFDLDDVRSFVIDNVQKKGTYFRCKK